MTRKQSQPYDAGVYETIAKEISEGPPLTCSDPITQERVAKAVERAYAAGHASSTVIASRLNKHGVPDARGRVGRWDVCEVVLARERATKIAAAAYVKANPRTPPTRAELEAQHAEADAAAMANPTPDLPEYARDVWQPSGAGTMRERFKKGISRGTTTFST